MCFMFQNLVFPKYLDPESVRKKNGVTKFCNSKAIDYYNVNSNLMTQRLCTFSLIIHTSHLPSDLFSNDGLSQNCSIVTYKI